MITELNKLIETIRSKIKDIKGNSREERARKGAYVDIILLIKDILDRNNSLTHLNQ